MNVLDGDRLRVSDGIASRSSILRTGLFEWPLDGMACPTADGGGSFHDGKFCTLDCRDLALKLKTLADDVRSGTSFSGGLMARVLRPRAPSVVWCITTSSEVASRVSDCPAEASCGG
jgi:hypothetical protein